MRRYAPLIVAVALAALMMSVLVGLSVGLIAGRMFRRPDTRPGFQDSPTVIRQVQALSQLVTVRFSLEKVVILEDAKWYGENRLIMVAHGVAKAGFDLEKMQAGDIAVRGDHLTLTLPRPRLTEVFLDDRRTQILERSTGLMRQFDQTLEQSARREALEKIRIAAVEGGILREAEEKARLQLALLGRQLGFAEVEIKVKP